MRKTSSLPDTPLTEDGYYALTVARNIAMGNGITIDGEMWTNGFQPLFTLLCVPLFWLAGGDQVLALRFLLVLHAAGLAVAALTLGRILQDIGRGKHGSDQLALTAALGALVYVSSAYVFRAHFNALETGWLLLMYLLCWRYYQKVGVDSVARASGFGILLGLLVLTRIDAVFFVIVMASAELLRNGPFRDRAMRFVVIGGIAFLISLPWWSYNLLGFGSLMPTSGTAQEHREMGLHHVVSMVSSLSIVATPSYWFGQHEGLLTFSLRILMLGAILFVLPKALLRAGLAPEDAIAQRSWEYARNLAITVALLSIWYLFSLGTTWFYERYMAPFAILGTSALVIALLYHGVQRLRVATMVFALLLAAQMPLFIYWHHTNQVFRGSGFYNQHLEQVLRHVPETDVIASGQSGTLGYFRDRVVNCDGKVNSEVLAYRDNLGAYLDKKNINWWADQWFFADVDPESVGWREVSRSGTWLLYQRIEP